jgi:hypothetical protein
MLSPGSIWVISAESIIRAKLARLAKLGLSVIFALCALVIDPPRLPLGFSSSWALSGDYGSLLSF